jgi:hypothetical protein
MATHRQFIIRNRAKTSSIKYGKVSGVSHHYCLVRRQLGYSCLRSADEFSILIADAASLDKDLMEIGGWSLDQLMELAGLSVSQAGNLYVVGANIRQQYLQRHYRWFTVAANRKM